MNSTKEDGDEYLPLRLSTEDPLFSKASAHHAARLRSLTDNSRTYKTPFILTSILSTLLTLLCLVQWHTLSTRGNCIPTTDFEDARGAIEYEQRVFTGDIKLDRETREVYHDVPKGEKRWFGDPAVYPEIDENWKDLLGYEFLTLTTPEAEPFFSLPSFARHPSTSQYAASLSVIHGLHCLNAVRIHLDAPYYQSQSRSSGPFALHQDGPGYPANWTRTHMSHCLDQIRQLMTCASDLAPVPLQVEKEIRVHGAPLFVASGAQHTCRKFERVVEWLRVRKESVGAFGEFEAEDILSVKEKEQEKEQEKEEATPQKVHQPPEHARPPAPPLHPVRPTITRPKAAGYDGIHDRPRIPYIPGPVSRA